jgi:GT2 family glycosyltransferase
MTQETARGHEAPAPLDLSVLIVSWNVADLLSRCLASIEAQSQPTDWPQVRRLPLLDGEAPAALEVIVVDNASADDTVARIRQGFPWVQVQANADNAGFSRGNNQALTRSHGRWLLFLNPDTEVRPGALAILLDFAQTHAGLGVVGPRLIYPDGSVQSSRRRFPTVLTTFWESTLLEQWWPHNPWARRYRLEEVPDTAVQTVDWLVGACLLIPRAVMDQVGGWDEGFFMYSEELDLCRRIKSAGWQVVFTPQAEVIHYEGKSSEQIVAARHLRFQASKVRYARKYHGRLAAGSLRLFLLSTYAWQLLAEALKWLLGHKRALRAARISAYWSVLKSRLLLPS